MGDPQSISEHMVYASESGTVAPENSNTNNNRDNCSSPTSRGSPESKNNNHSIVPRHQGGTTIQTGMNKHKAFLASSKGNVEEHQRSSDTFTLRRTLSSASSDKSDEIILFNGRNRSEQAFSPSQDDLRPKPLTDSYCPLLPRKAGMKWVGDRNVLRPQDWLEESALADHQANICSSKPCELQDLSASFSRVCFAGSRGSDACHQKKLETAATQHYSYKQYQPGSESEPNSPSHNQLTIIDEHLNSTGVVLAKRHGPVGAEYWITFQGAGTKDTKWVSQTVLEQSAPVATPLYGCCQKHLETRIAPSCVSLETREQPAVGLEKDTGDDRGKKHLIEDCQAKMTDEEVAMRLEKQEELGLGSSKLLLFDGTEGWNRVLDGTEHDHVDNELLRQQAHKYSQATPSTDQVYKEALFSEKSFLKDLGNPDGDFDVMDVHIPSVSLKPRKRRDARMFDLSDHELEHDMFTAWENDRLKKKMRKQQREELRSQGLLGIRKTPTLESRYPNGMSFDQVKAELRRFLQSQQQR